MKITPRIGKAAFTLIELMAVITIIVILAGLVVGGMGFVSERQAKEKARVQIALLSKGLEDFKLDNGFYPPGKKNTTTGAVEEDAAAGNSNAIYKALFWDTDFDSTEATNGKGEPVDLDQKNYLNELNPTMVPSSSGTYRVSNKQGWIDVDGANATIKDPWGKEYQYRKGTTAQNPDFDLWSMGKDGKTKPETPTDATNRDDIKNF